MKRLLICLLVAGCGAEFGAGTGGSNGDGGPGGSGGSGGAGGGLPDAPTSDGAAFDGGGTGGSGGSGGTGGQGDAGPPCAVALQVPPGPFFAGDPISLSAAFSGPGNATQYVWSTSQGNVVGTGAMVTLDTTTEGTYLLGVTVYTDLNGSCNAFAQPVVEPRDPRYVRLRVTPPVAGAPRQAFAILPSGMSQAADLMLQPGTPQNLSITAGGSSVAGYLRLTDHATCLPVEAYPSATAAVQLNLMPVPFDVLVIPANSLLAPFLYSNHNGSFAMGVLPGTAVAGRVLASDGSPIANARIELTNGTLPSSIASTRASDGAFDAHTWITAAPLDAILAPPDSSLPIAQTSGAPIPALGVTPPPLVFTYDPVTPAHVSGTVTLPGGGAAIGAHLVFTAHQPFARVGQLAVGGGSPMPVGGTARAEAITGPSGGFGPIALPPAIYDVLVEPPSGPPVARLRTTVDLSAGDQTPSYALGALVLLAGTIADAGGQPQPATVRAVERGASATFVLPQLSSTFNVYVDPGATYDVYATPDPTSGLARASGTITVPQGGAQLALTVQPGVTFTGHVTDASGAVSGAIVEALLGADCTVSTTVVADTLSARDGLYRIVVPVP